LRAVRQRLGRPFALAAITTGLVASCRLPAGSGTAPDPGSPAVDDAGVAITGDAAVAPPTTALGRYKVTIVNASIASKRPDGKPWHVQRPNGALKLVAGVAGRFLGVGDTGAEIGAMVSGGEKEVAPRAYVELHVAGTSYRTFAEDPTLAPAWNHELAVDLDGVGLDSPVVLLIKDGLDDGVIGQGQLTVGQLIGQPGHTVAGSASVPIISLAVAPLAPKHSELVTVTVPANLTFEQLTAPNAPAATGYRVIHVEAGDQITVKAQGQVCIDDIGGCYGPEGLQKGLPVPGSFSRIAWIGAEDSYDSFKTSPHGTLVAMVGGVPARIAKETTFAPHRSGDIVLFVNDRNPAKNRGSFQVEVRINPEAEAPLAPTAPTAPPRP
jgi:hypothetical protein